MPTPRRRRRTALLVLLGAVLVLVLGSGAWVWTLYSDLDDITRFDLDKTPGANSPPRPEPAPDSDAVTMLLAGVDNGTRSDLHEMLASGEWQPGVFRSDMIMVMHIPADRERAYLVSIPRDSWVPVHGYGRQKINAAFSYGGPALLAQTVEQITDVRLDHVMVVDWDGFQGITEVLGGVEVDGEKLSPDEALAYVRERKSLPGGDFDRVERQQEYLLGVLKGIRRDDMLSSPISLTRLVDSLNDFVAVDSSLSTQTMIDLAWSSRRVSPSDVQTHTAPTNGTATVAGQSIVRLDVADTRALLDDIVGAPAG